MSVEQHNVDRVDLARRIIFMLHQEELKIFGKNPEGSLYQRIDRLLSAGGSVDPTVYKLAYTLKAWHVRRG
ncbi:MAG: hypothetical protein WA214_22860 [Pseudolabrys sp.]|jgi:hypothetical protein